MTAEWGECDDLEVEVCLVCKEPGMVAVGGPKGWPWDMCYHRNGRVFVYPTDRYLAHLARLRGEDPSVWCKEPTRMRLFDWALLFCWVLSAAVTVWLIALVRW